MGGVTAFDPLSLVDLVRAYGGLASDVVLQRIRTYGLPDLDGVTSDMKGRNCVVTGDPAGCMGTACWTLGICRARGRAPILAIPTLSRRRHHGNRPPHGTRARSRGRERLPLRAVADAGRSRARAVPPGRGRRRSQVLRHRNRSRGCVVSAPATWLARRAPTRIGPANGPSCSRPRPRRNPARSPPHALRLQMLLIWKASAFARAGGPRAAAQSTRSSATRASLTWARSLAR